MSPFFRRRRKPEPEPEPDPPADAEGSMLGSETLFDVKRAQARDDSSNWQGSWERLSDKVHGYLRARFGRARLPYDVEFDDLFSAVLACMLRDLPRLQFDAREEFWGWVKTVATHQIADFWRRHDRQRRGGGRVSQQQADDDVDFVESAQDEHAHSASVIMRVNELEQAEMDCVERLTTEEARQVYLLRRKFELSYEEIARQLGRENADVIRAAFHRAKDKVLACLRTKLDGYGDIAAKA